MFTDHGSTRESVGAKPSRIAPVRRGSCTHHHLSPYPFVVRKNGKAVGSGPPSRHNSRSWIGGGEADAQLPSLVQVLQDKCPTTEPEQLVKESYNHQGERCTSPEPEEHDREMRRPMERTGHQGERCLSPERKFKCEGWCKDKSKMSRTMTTFDHPDVVR